MQTEVTYRALFVPIWKTTTNKFEFQKFRRKWKNNMLNRDVCFSHGNGWMGKQGLENLKEKQTSAMQL